MRSTSALYLFFGTLLMAGGYGATFLISAWFRSHGGTDIEAGATLSMALVGTLLGVPLVGWFAGRLDASRLAALAALAMSGGYLLLGSSDQRNIFPSIAALLIGLGWGMFYIGGPMALSERITDAERGHWFTRFSAFQMAGICGGPVVLTILVEQLQVSLQYAFLLVGATGILAALLLAIFGNKEPGPQREVRLRTWFRKITRLAASSAGRPIVMVGLGGCVFSGMMSFQGSLVDGTRASASTFFMVHAVTVVIARLLLARRLSVLPRTPLVSVLLCCMTCGLVCLLGIPLHPGFQIAAAVLTGIGYGLVYPVIQTWAVNDSAPADRHAALTWFVVSYFIGIFGFPLFGGWLLVEAGKVWFITALALIALLELAAALMGRQPLASR
ncbi:MULTISPECIES: MFS transporter [Erwinia]|uniref:MFS transporter n=1 Tax=Erwinia TaxID=551 RepID=UPI00105EFD49|nr:MFS transporter [Erwinia aphidicola]MCP2231366.1 MFS family permease [Erwinia aphidicola]